MIKQLIFAIALCLTVSAPMMVEADETYHANTGDKSFDIYLSDMELRARADMPGFVGEMSYKFGRDERKLKLLVREEKLGGADLYMALALSDETGKSLDAVIRNYKDNKGKGWGTISRKMGVKPGSPEFHALKKKGKAGKKHGKGQFDDRGMRDDIDRYEDRDRFEDKDMHEDRGRFDDRGMGRYDDKRPDRGIYEDRGMSNGKGRGKPKGKGRR